MSFGLSRIIKNLLPKQLFYRGLLIVATPIIILQITISIVFLDSLWIKTTKGMTRALVAEIKTFIDAYDNDETNKEFVIVLFKEHLKFNIKYVEKESLPLRFEERWYSPIDRSLRRELKSKNLEYWFDTTTFKHLIDVGLKEISSGSRLLSLFVDPLTSEITYLTGSVPFKAAQFPERHPVAQEFYVLGGTLAGNCGIMHAGAYCWRPPMVVHGPYGSPTGALILLRSIGGPLTTELFPAVNHSYQPEHKPVLPSDLADAGNIKLNIPNRY